MPKSGTPGNEENKALDSTSEGSPIEKRVQELEELIVLQGDAMDQIKDMLKDFQEKTSSGVQAPQAVVPEGIEEKLAELDDMKRKVDQIDEVKQSFAKFMGEVSSMKGKMQQPSAPVSVNTKGLEDALNSQISSIKGSLSSIESRMSSVESSTQSLDNQIQGLKSSVSRMEGMDIEGRLKGIGNFDGGRAQMESLRNDLNKKMEDYRKVLESKIFSIDSKIPKSSSPIDLRPINERLGRIEGQLNSTAQPGTNAVGKDIESRMRSLQEDVKNVAFQAQEPLSVLNIQMSDMLGKFIAIEMRLATLEKNVEKFVSVRPIVLE